MSLGGGDSVQIDCILLSLKLSEQFGPVLIKHDGTGAGWCSLFLVQLFQACCPTARRSSIPKLPARSSQQLSGEDGGVAFCLLHVPCRFVICHSAAPMLETEAMANAVDVTTSSVLLMQLSRS